MAEKIHFESDVCMARSQLADFGMDFAFSYEAGQRIQRSAREGPTIGHPEAGDSLHHPNQGTKAELHDANPEQAFENRVLLDIASGNYRARLGTTGLAHGMQSGRIGDHPSTPRAW